MSEIPHLSSQGELYQADSKKKLRLCYLSLSLSSPSPDLGFESRPQRGGLAECFTALAEAGKFDVAANAAETLFPKAGNLCQ